MARNKWTNPDNSIAQMSLPQLRHEWAKYWGMTPHRRIGRTMLEKSLIFKIRESKNAGLTPDQQEKVSRIVKDYSQNPKTFAYDDSKLKPGILLQRIYKNKTYSVTVKDDGFEFNNKTYTSLSQIAFDITGTRWNGWVFFGVKNREKKA